MKTTLAAFFILFLLCGCKTVTTSKTSTDVLKVLHTTDPGTGASLKSTEPMSVGLQNVYQQVFGTNAFSKINFSVTSKDNKEYELNNYAVEANPLPATLAKSSVIRKLTESVAFGTKPKFGRLELNSFATDFYSTMENGPFTLSNQPTLFTATKNKKVAFGNILSAYYIAYQKGKFVLRDGTTLSKPTVSIKTNGGKISGGLDNDTINGLLTVFEEAFYDYTLATPLFFSQSISTNYSETFVKLTASDYFQKLYSQNIETNQDFLLEGSTPTAILFMKTLELVSKDKPTGNPFGISERELKFIRFTSGFAGTHSKSLSGLIARSFGSIDGGAVVVMGSFSIGNNETLAKIIESIVSCSSRRLSEHELTKAFETYQNKKPEIEFLLNNYESIAKQIDKLGN